MNGGTGGGPMMTSLSMGGGGGSIGADLRDIGRGKEEEERGNERERRPAATCHGWLCHDM